MKVPGLPQDVHSSPAPGALYRLRFAAKGDAGGGGSIVSGVSRVNRDFHATDSWREHAFIFSFPSDATSDYARLGQWEIKGRVSFDDAELLPVLATHARLPGGAELGEAESVRGGVYRFAPILGWAGANAHRTLLMNRASFNSDRWLFFNGSELVYRVGVRGVAQRSATLRVPARMASGSIAAAAHAAGAAGRTEPASLDHLPHCAGRAGRNLPLRTHARHHARLFADYLGQVEQHLRSRGWLDMAYTYFTTDPRVMLEHRDRVARMIERLQTPTP